MADKDFDLISIGNISIDTIKVQNNGAHVVPGGSAAAVLTAAANFNLRTGLISKIGGDFPDEWLVDLASRGIDIRGIKKQKKSCRFELTYAEKGNLNTFKEKFNSEHTLSASDIPEAYLNSRHFHLSAAHPSNQAKFLKRLSKLNHNSTISLALWPSYKKEYNSGFMKHLKKVEILFCNDLEAKILAREENIYAAVKKIAKSGPKTIVLTKGAKGSAVYHSKEFYLFPALRTSILDRTGCGDSFAGGFLASYLKGDEIESAGWVGTALASFTISKFGSWFPAEITNGKIKERMERAHAYYDKGLKKEGTLMDFF